MVEYLIYIKFYKTKSGMYCLVEQKANYCHFWQQATTLNEKYEKLRESAVHDRPTTEGTIPKTLSNSLIIAIGKYVCIYVHVTDTKFQSIISVFTVQNCAIVSFKVPLLRYFVCL